VHGGRLGQQIDMCREPKCPQHRGRYSYGSSSSGKKDFWEQRAQKLKSRIEIESRKRTLKAILAKSIDWKIPHDQGLLILDAILPNSPTVELAEALGIAKSGKSQARAFPREAPNRDLIRNIARANRQRLPQIILAAALFEATKEYQWGESGTVKRLSEAAKCFKVDEKKIQKATDAEMSADFKKRRAASEARKKAADTKAKPQKKLDDGPKVHTSIRWRKGRA